MGRLHGEIVRVLLGLVRGDAAPAVRRMATFCLRELAPDQPAAAQALLEASRDDDTHVRRAALTAMAGLLDPPAPVVARLDEALDDADAGTAGIAALALGELGRAERAAAPARARRVGANAGAAAGRATVGGAHGGTAMKRSVIVTGGTGGLGGVVVSAFLASGDRVVVPWIVEHESARLREHFADALRAAAARSWCSRRRRGGRRRERREGGRRTRRAGERRRRLRDGPASRDRSRRLGSPVSA